MNYSDLKFEYPLYLLEVFCILSGIYNNDKKEESYLVGGCVRDILLNKNPKDFDVVTNIPIENVITEFSNNGWKVSEAGKQFLVCIISKNGISIEIANFRNDLTYIDGRRPEAVEIGTIEDDWKLRDITINALYCNPFTGEILDPSKKGLLDLNNKIIRLCNNQKTLTNDYLRIMRIYRFAIQYKFNIDKNTLTLCRKLFDKML
jgi:tRNA nucleotidyltransferase/poly(A) polymerase